MLNSLSLRQQHFLYQRKNLYLPILGRIFSGEPVPEDTNMQLARWSLSFYLSGFPRTLSEIAERGPGASLRLRKYREDGGDFSITGCKTKTLHKDCLTSARVHGSTLRWNVCVMYQKYIVWASASYIFLMHVFSRQNISLVLPDSEAVSISCAELYCL